MKREVTVLENRADTNGKFLAAGIALPKAVLYDAFGMFLARLGADAFKAAKAFLRAAMRAYGAVRPKLALDIGESRWLIVEARIEKNRTGHGCYLQWPEY